jgi:glucoamylase
MESLQRWVERQYRHSAVALMRSVSPQSVKFRAGFGQAIAAKKGSVVASPVLADYDPEPDYFFHWYRDSAVVMNALHVLASDPTINVDAAAHFSDFVHFSLSLRELDGRGVVRASAWRDRVAPDYRKFLRTDQDLSAAHGEALAGETRVNADGTLDISSWPRPQNDGPALRAICLLRWISTARFDARFEDALTMLLRADLRFTLRHWRESCFDIWEEEKGLHYYTLRVAAAALEAGARWFARQGEIDAAEACSAETGAIMSMLDGYWRDDLQFYRSRVLDLNAISAKELDISVILAVLHAGGSGGLHSVHDPRSHATLARLEALFDAEYAINRNRGESTGPAMGRYKGDVYFAGGAYYFSTLAAAEFCYRAARGAPTAQALITRGDAFLATVRHFTPANGDMSEQFDQRTGAQCSAQQLAWSYAAFITCIEARRLCATKI